MNEEYDYENMHDELGHYESCLKNISERINLIKSITNKPIDAIPDRYCVELICLQFRSIIEMLYIGFLVLHMKKYKLLKTEDTFKNQWRIEQIVKFLNDENKDYYPVAVQVIKHSNEMIAIPQGYLIKGEWKEIVNETSDFVHARNPFNPYPNPQNIITKFPIWLNKIVVLLTTHTIKIKGKNKFIFANVDFPTNKTLVMYASENKPSNYTFGHLERQIP